MPDVPASPMSAARSSLRMPVTLMRVVAEHFKDALALTRRALTTRHRGQTRMVDAPTKRILIVDDLVPDPRFGAGYPRAFAIVQAMVKAGHQVSFYPMASTRADVARLSAAFAGAVSFHAGRGSRGLRRLLWTDGETFDVLFISRPSPMRAFVETRHLREDGFRPAVIYDAEAVLSPREARRRALFGTAWSGTEYKTALDAELGLARGATTVTAVSPQDAQTIESVLSIPVFVLPHPVATTSNVPPFSGRKDFLFVGRLTGAASESPNVDSILWFVTEIMPVLDRMLAVDYTLHIAGLVDCPELDEVVSARVVRHGVVEDLTALYDQCKVFIAPTRYAAGIPLKVIEAMGHGIPCVATPLLAEQLSATGAELPTGESPQQFAAHCVRLYTDPTSWQSGSKAGRNLVERAYSQDAFDRVLAQTLDHIDRPHAIS